MVQLLNVTVRQQAGNGLTVATANNADLEVGPTDSGVILNLPVATQNGGPQIGPFPAGNIYRITGTTADNQAFNQPGFRYIGLTPGGNYQFTTE